MTAPAGAGALPGVEDLYAAYDSTQAAKAADPSRANIDAAGEAMQALSDAREYWRRIRDAVNQQAYDEWAAANPEAAAALASDLEV